MVKIIPITDLESLVFLQHQKLPDFDIQQCHLHRCDAHLVVFQDKTITARCSLWWTDTPSLEGQRLGVIGHFSAINEVDSRELLAAACTTLSEHHCTLAIGPMDGNTWHRYRFITERGSEPAFFLEPDNPDEWPQWFINANFSPLATFFSGINEDLSVEDSRIPRTLERLELSGVTLRTIQIDQFDEELRRIYEVSCQSFQSNYLYYPISESEFMNQYQPIVSYIRPEFVILAEHENRPIGFIFGIPDLAQARLGGSIDTVIVKTVAVLPGRTFAGLGNVLVARCQQAAKEYGFRRVIHALMHESNNSLNLSGHYAKPFRRYTLFSHSLKLEI